MSASVIIPVHDRTEFIASALQSVYNQTRLFDGVYVIANINLDIEKEIGNYFEFSNFHIYKVKDDVGLAEKLNLGMSLAQTDFVLPLCDDDLLDPTFLNETSQAMDDFHVVYTDRRLFGLDNRVVYSGDWNLEDFKRYNPIPFTSLVKRDVWKQLKFRNIPFLDWDFWWIACECGFSAYHVPEPLFRLRTHLGQYSRVVNVKDATKEVLDAHPTIGAKFMDR
jgi:glycosyltransferase involved in cell wall biosynthesis